MSTKDNQPQGTKTHQLQKDIIAGRVDTSNAGKDFDPRPYLGTPKEARDRITETHLPGEPTPVASEDGNPSPRGLNQESQHHKKSGKPEDQKG